MMLEIIPVIDDPKPNPNAYGIRHNMTTGKWEAIMLGEVVATRNTATDAGYALIGMEERDAHQPDTWGREPRQVEPGDEVPGVVAWPAFVLTISVLVAGFGFLGCCLFVKWFVN